MGNYLQVHICLELKWKLDTQVDLFFIKSISKTVTALGKKKKESLTCANTTFNQKKSLAYTSCSEHHAEACCVRASFYNTTVSFSAMGLQTYSLSSGSSPHNGVVGSANQIPASMCQGKPYASDQELLWLLT